MEGQKEFVQIDQNDLFPYLLVNIGSGVSIIKVKTSFLSPFIFSGNIIIDLILCYKVTG